MPLLLKSQPVPLRTDDDGVVRVGGTRVTLDTVISCFKQGVSAEGIAEQYPSLRLADIYNVVSYYLDQTAEIEQYLREQEAKGHQVRQQNESRFDPTGIRARLVARRS